MSVKDEDLNKIKKAYLDYGVQVGIGVVIGGLLAGGTFTVILGLAVVGSVFVVKANETNDGEK